MTDSTTHMTRLPEAASPIPTQDVLLALGFKKDSSVLSDGDVGLSFDFGNFKLEASQNVNRYFQTVMILGGVMTTARSVTAVHFEIPLEVESFEQGVALVTHCLDRHAGGTFVGTFPVAWLNEGRKRRDRLPWYKKSAD